MKCIYRIILSFLFICPIILLPTSVSALEVIDQSSNIFKFQQKLAKKGNAHAQYKLAIMYETGTGVESDTEKAKQWYGQASKAGIKAAMDRIIYLTVKEQGYQKNQHSDWLKSVKADASERKAEAMFLLGQLYRDGIGVRKDLNKSLALLIYVSSSGDIDVDDEIASIQDKIDANRAAAKQLKKRRVTNPVVLVKAKPEPAKIEQSKGGKIKKQQAAAVVKVEKERLIRAEKRRKYEMVMEQIRLEQQKIDELQEQVSGGEVASIDDEI